MKTNANGYRGYRFPREIISHSVWLYHRFSLSFRDVDTHLRPSFTYAWSDAISLGLGANIIAGKESGFFGQLERNSNIYGRLRYSF